MAKKEGFLLYYKALENLKTLGNDIAMEVIYAMSKYDQGEDVDKLSPMAQFAFNAYIPYLNSAKKRYEKNIKNGNNGGRPKSDTGEPKDNPGEPKDNPGEPKDNPGEPKDNQIDTDTDTDTENENENKGDFSFAESLNPNLEDFSQRLEKLRERYNSLNIGPPFKKTALNLTSPELSDLTKIMQTYQDDVSLKAMRNYSEIIKSPEHDTGGCVYRGFISFMVRGVEKYCDEAKPFELFKKRASGLSPPGESFNDWSNFGEEG